MKYTVTLTFEYTVCAGDPDDAVWEAIRQHDEEPETRNLAAHTVEPDEQPGPARDNKPLLHGPMCECSRCTSCF